MRNDLLEASVSPQPVPAGLGDPEPVLALVREVPSALVQAPQAGGVGRGCLVEHEETAICQRAMDVGQRLCSRYVNKSVSLCAYSIACCIHEDPQNFSRMEFTLSRLL